MEVPMTDEIRAIMSEIMSGSANKPQSVGVE
jgi:hypothetical protein